MEINKIGEFGLIDRIRRWVKTDASVVKGIGDDCAVIKYTKDKYLLFTCDAIIQDVDFKKSDNPYLVGRKAIAVNISDIAAMAGEPKYALVSLGLPKKTSFAYIRQLYAGINYWAKKFRVNVVGGDISRADKIIINISMIGFTEKKNLILRSTAEEKDIIVVSGPLGGSRHAKHLAFTPRLREARDLVKNYKINSMIDISDGLLQDLRHILKESKKGAVIYADLIPLSKDAHSLNDALTMGEDFELLLTLTLAEAGKLLEKRRNFKAIGFITKKNIGLVLKDKTGKVIKIKSEGFQHF